MSKYVSTLIAAGAVLLWATYSYAANCVVEVKDGVYIPQDSALHYEVIPSEENSSKTSWYGGPHSVSNGGVRFYDSWNWGTPAAW